jgi:hypothetical protein
MVVNLNNVFPWKEADEMLNLLVERAVTLVSSRPGSSQEQEFNSIATAVESYAAKRWPVSGPSNYDRHVGRGANVVSIGHKRRRWH